MGFEGSSEDLAVAMRSVCQKAGLLFEQLDPELLGRMRLLAQRSKVFEDNARAMELAEHVFEYYAH